MSVAVNIACRNEFIRKLPGRIVGATTDVDGLYVFYRTSATSQYVTYKLLPGEKVSSPFDPMANETKTNWYFVAWLLRPKVNANGVDNLRGKTTSPTDSNISNNSYIFDTPVTEDITLSTSWTSAAPQTFEFNVRNHIEGGSPEEEFTYLISVTEEMVWGKLGNSGTNNAGSPDQHWGIYSFNLKNDEEYRVLIKVKYRPLNYGWDACSVEIDVIDSDGNIIKNGHVIYANKNSNKRYAGGYRYKLSITQVEKTNYISSVSVTNESFDTWTINQSSPCFFFESIWGSSYVKDTEVNYGNFLSTFVPSYNGYVENGKESLTIVFANTKPVAPTDYRDSSSPYLWLFAAGLVLFAIAIIYGRRKAFVQE